jgi:hypothetical protein
MTRPLNRKFKSILGSLLIVAVGAVVFEGTTTLATGAKGCGPDGCLDVWNPVICSNGVVYSNMCYAQRACAKGCHPY